MRFLGVLDFEATCWPEGAAEPAGWHQEIIEFPVIILDTEQDGWPEVARFHEYCRPVHSPALPPFCTELTGITQETVDAARTFPEVFDAAQTFLSRFELEGLGLVTCGNWDLKVMLPAQLRLIGCGNPHESPTVFRRWLNVKQLYDKASGLKGKKRAKGMVGMLNSLGLPLIGRHHSGIDDAANIAQILRTVAPRYAEKNNDLWPWRTLSV